MTFTYPRAPTTSSDNMPSLPRHITLTDDVIDQYLLIDLKWCVCQCLLPSRRCHTDGPKPENVWERNLCRPCCRFKRGSFQASATKKETKLHTAAMVPSESSFFAPFQSILSMDFKLADLMIQWWNHEQLLQKSSYFPL